MIHATNKKLIDKANKFLSDKRLIQKYLRGEATLQDLDKAGIKLAMPI